MNPLCWNVLLLETKGDRYSVREGVLSALPAALPVERCPKVSGSWPTSAPLRPVAAAAPAAAGALLRRDPREISWLGEFTMSRALLMDVVASYCDAAALMQFARAPFVTGLGRGWVMGDLRFAGEGGGMATIMLWPPSRGECRRSVPWTAPREDLLQSKKGETR